ncbi:phage virion morphogenesis protein [Kerstersia gyiorum]|uniref:phage virion morphogenesis protein n=1 Tax=Pseudomonadota TaxID=1224 RepID=UPI0006D3E5D0|nr:phage virion morphogenesis protein [Pseudomonas sp. NBRC 111143]
MIRIELDDQDVKRALAGLEHAVGDIRPALKNIGEAMLFSIDQRFADQEAPDGTAWEGNAPATIARKGFDDPLVGAERNLTLRTQNIYQLEGDALLVGNTMEYAAMQQFGGDQQDFPHLWGDIPAREFIGISDEDEEEIVEIITDHIAMGAGTR